jgi:mannosyl-3-phosphoglycerate phosphatase family protein
MKSEHEKLVVFTDLDGTLLDPYSYDCGAAVDAIAMLREHSVPLVLCSAKTRTEIEVYRRLWSLHDPFVVEDGAAAFVEAHDPCITPDFRKTVNGLRVAEVGVPYSRLRAMLDEAAQSHRLPVRGFGQVSPKEIASVTGLTLVAAERAKHREYSETLISDYNESQLIRLDTALRARGLRLRHGGRFYGVTGDHDKGTGVALLLKAYRTRLDHLITIGIGDSANDEGFLRLVDVPILVQRPDGSWADLDVPNLHRAPGVGPVAWDRAIRDIFASQQDVRRSHTP